MVMAPITGLLSQMEHMQVRAFTRPTISLEMPLPLRQIHLTTRRDMKDNTALNRRLTRAQAARVMEAAMTCMSTSLNLSTVMGVSPSRGRATSAITVMNSADMSITEALQAIRAGARL